MLLHIGMRPANVAIDWRSENRVLFVDVADGAGIVELKQGTMSMYRS